MSHYVRASAILKPINDVFGIDDRYKRPRDRCNGHTHYNFYRYAMLNDNEIHMGNRGWWLDRFSEDVRDLFVMHLGYIFFLNDRYFMSSDYQSELERGIQPEDGSQFLVAPFSHAMFDKVITQRHPQFNAVTTRNHAMKT